MQREKFRGLDLVVVWLHGHGDEQGDVNYKSSFKKLK